MTTSSTHDEEAHEQWNVCSDSDAFEGPSSIGREAKKAPDLTIVREVPDGVNAREAEAEGREPH